MQVALIMNDTVENIIEIESVPAARSLLPQYDDIVAVSNYPNICIGAVRNGDDWDPPPLAPRDVSEVEAEKLRRLEFGFPFQDNMYQTRPVDISSINGATLGASLAVILEQKQPGDLRWANPDKDFFWITKDNENVAMDAHTMTAFGKTAMGYVTHITTRARYLKDEILTGTVYEDITIDALWV